MTYATRNEADEHLPRPGFRKIYLLDYQWLSEFLEDGGADLHGGASCTIEDMAAKETPATGAARKAGIAFTLHAYDHDPRADSFALEAADALNIDPARVFKTLIITKDNELGVCIVPAAEMLNLRALGKRAAMAPTDRAERVTGYVAGGISPLGQRKRLSTIVDESAFLYDTIFVSGGRRGLEIELAPDDLVALTGASVQALT